MCCVLTLGTFKLMSLDIQISGTLIMLAVDERCGMELDETDPAIWLKLEAATEEYIQKNFQAFKNVCELLVPRYQEEEKSSEITKSLSFSRLKSSNSGLYSTDFSALCNNLWNMWLIHFLILFIRF